VRSVQPERSSCVIRQPTAAIHPANGGSEAANRKIGDHERRIRPQGWGHFARARRVSATIICFAWLASRDQAHRPAPQAGIGCGRWREKRRKTRGEKASPAENQRARSLLRPLSSCLNATNWRGPTRARRWPSSRKSAVALTGAQLLFFSRFSCGVRRQAARCSRCDCPRPQGLRVAGHCTGRPNGRGFAASRAHAANFVNRRLLRHRPMESLKS